MRRRLLPFIVYTLFSKSDFTRSLFITYLVQLGLAHGQIGALQAVMFLGSLTVEIPSGVLADKIGRKRVILLGHLCLMAVGAGFLISGDFWHLIIVFVLWGVGTSALSGAEEALLYESFKDEKVEFTRVLGWIRALSSLALAGSFFAGGQLRYYGWMAVYLAYIASKVLAATVVLFIPETIPAKNEWPSLPASISPMPVLEVLPSRTPLSETTPTASSTSETAEPVSIKELIKYLGGPGRIIILPIVAVALLDAAITPFYIFSQEMFRMDGLSPAYIGVTYAVVELLASVSCLLGHVIKRWVGISLSLILSLLAVGVILLLNRVVVSPQIGVVFVATAVIIPQGVYVIFESHLQDVAPPHLRASTFSAYSFVVFLTVSVAYLCYGSAIQVFGIRSAGLLLSFLSALGIVVMLIFSANRVSTTLTKQV